MRRLCLFLAVACAAAMLYRSADAVTPTGAVVLSEVYPGGGNKDATYTNDYVELFNRTASVVSFTGWSIGYSSRESTTWRSVPLRGSINPFHYFLVRMGSGGTPGTSALPPPDVSGSVNIARTGGKVRLYNGNTTIDLLGFGAGVNAYEGKPIAAPKDNTHSLVRVKAGCTDTNNNATDFRIWTPGPRNKTNDGFRCSTSASPPPSTSPRPSATATARPSPTPAPTVRPTPKPTPTADPWAGRSEITLDVTEEVNRIAASGVVRPSHPDSYVTVKLFRYQQREWQRQGFERVRLDTRSAYRATFPHPMMGRCLITAAFPGSDDHPPARIQKEIAC